MTEKKENAVSAINDAFLSLCKLLQKAPSLDRSSGLRKAYEVITENYSLYIKERWHEVYRRKYKRREEEDYCSEFMLQVMELLCCDNFNKLKEFAKDYKSDKGSQQYPGFAYLNSQIERHCISEANADFLKEDGLPPSAAKYRSKMMSEAADFEKKTGHSANREEWETIAKEKDVPKKDADILYEFSQTSTISIDQPINEDEDDTIEDIIPDEDADVAFDFVYNAPLESTAEIYTILERILEVSSLNKITHGIDTYMGLTSGNLIDIEVLSIGQYDNILPEKGKDRTGSPAHLNAIIAKCQDDVRIRIVFPEDYIGNYRRSVKSVYTCFLDRMKHLNDGDIAALFNIMPAQMTKIKCEGNQVMELYRTNRK